MLGLGAGWFELEHQQLGFDFDTFTERFEKLEEALQIIVPMTHGERPTFSGKWYRTESAINEPRYRDHIPVMLGGSGEKKAFGMAARYADHLNLITPISELAAQARCAQTALRRSRDAILDLGDPSTLLTVVLDGYDTNSATFPRRTAGRAVRGTAATSGRADQDQRARRRRRRRDRQPAHSRLHAGRHHRGGKGATPADQP